ncbi:Alcohol dehydrogenase [acceptor] [Lachnellula suecica]|uniref:Alcohol dehydrogenase [acceptor] n=1 Tax=Lachnellula suecica TaxID=602035 RepID=A0A8T9CAW1_9HELO|nr:Alcohol dehydrogenase [acceptor] [Lachnellula suecica]
MADSFDFIVVGGGTSGCVVARRLADSRSGPKVLLLEGGGPNNSPDLLLPAQRSTLVFTNPELNWGYKSIPQSQLNDREILCPRGRGLGGSSAVNFSCWLVGDKEDFNEWAELVDDPCWRWDGEVGVKKRFRKIENVHNELTDEQAKYISREALDEHSHEGNVDLSYPKIWGQLEAWSIDAGKEYGQSEFNGDINSGNAVGFGLGPSTYYKGARVTAATAYLSNPPPNLTILTNSVVSKVLFNDSKRAIGVSTLSGLTFHASKEVVLSAGAFDTPKVLLLSGIGASIELAQHSIPIVHELPGVGKNLKDHCYLPMTVLLNTTATLKKKSSDPTSDVGNQTPMAWLSSPAVKSSPEFHSLPQPTRDFLQKVPSYEMICTSLDLGTNLPRPDAETFMMIAAVMNPQSSGSITLGSSDPSMPMLIDLNYLSHPYDRRVAIEGIRAAMALSRVHTFVNISEEVLEGPKSESEEDIIEYCKEFVQPVYHFAGTCCMGREGDEMSVVDKEFRVRGTSGLRVADHSIAPLMVNNHTQSTCYLISIGFEYQKLDH